MAHLLCRGVSKRPEEVRPEALVHSVRGPYPPVTREAERVPRTPASRLPEPQSLCSLSLKSTAFSVPFQVTRYLASN